MDTWVHSQWCLLSQWVDELGGPEKLKTVFPVRSGQEEPALDHYQVSGFQSFRVSGLQRLTFMIYVSLFKSVELVIWAFIGFHKWHLIHSPLSNTKCN